MAFTTGSPGSGQLDLGIAIVLHDKFSNPAREASRALKQLHQEAKMAITANVTAGQALVGVFNDAMASAGAFLNESVTLGANFIDTMTTVGAISGATASQMEVLADTAQTIGVQTMFMSRDIASGMQFLAMAGNKAQQINDMIRGAAMMANATGMELGGKGGTADLLTNIMRTFKLEGEEAANVVGDQLTKAVLSANTNMMDLAAAIKYSAASLVTLKQGLPQVAAMVGTLGNAGIQGSMAGTSLRNMADYFVKSITNPNFQGAKALEQLGLGHDDFVDAQGDLIDFASILEKIRDRVSGLSSIEQNSILRSIFGVRGQRGAVAIMNDIEGYRALLNDIQNNSQGFAENVVEKRMGTIAGKLDIVASAFENIQSTFTRALDNAAVRGILTMVSKFLEGIQWILSTPIGPFIATVTSGLIMISRLAGRFISTIFMLKLIFNDSQVSIGNMFRTLMTGWTGATVSAKNYSSILNIILAQQKGMSANIGGGLVYSPRGRGAKFRDAKTGRFVSTTSKEVVERLTGTGTAAVAGGMAMRGALVSTGKGILRVGSRILGFLGGPVGIALTVGATLLPTLIGAVRKNSDATENNINSSNELAAAIREYASGERKKATPEQEFAFIVAGMKEIVRAINEKKLNQNIRLVSSDGSIIELNDEDTEGLSNRGVK